MNKTGIAYLDFAWNPCGFGCSHGCPTCFARRQATSTGPTAPKCPDCRAFLFHFHPERLERKLSPAGHRKPAVIGVQFLGDLFDELRPSGEIYGVLAAVYAAPQHTYVFLTQRPAKAAIHLMEWYSTGGGGHVTGGGLPRNWHVGCTIKGPGPQAMEDIAALCQIRGRLWLSLEPLAGNVEFYHLNGSSYLHGVDALGCVMPGRIEGVVIGCDNQLSEPWTNSWARHAIDWARQVDGLKVYVKQLIVFHCATCGHRPTEAELGRMDNWQCPACGRPTVLRSCSHDPATFPPDLRDRELPWTLTTKQP